MKNPFKITTACFKNMAAAMLLLLLSAGSSGAQNIYDAAHSWKYAQHLYQQKDYEAAAEEYLRVLKLQANNYEALDSALSVLEKIGKYPQIVNLLNNHFNANEIPNKYRHILIKGALKREQLDIARIHTNRLSESFPEKAAVYNVARLILAGEYKKAAASEHKFETGAKAKLIKLADSCRTIHFKRPAFYAVSAAIIPGSGHIAAGNSEMGMQYLFMFAANSFQAYKAYEIKGKADKYAFVFTGIAFGIYIGNIYGAYREAEFRNNQTREIIKRQVTEIIEQTGKQ